MKLESDNMEPPISPQSAKSGKFFEHSNEITQQSPIEDNPLNEIQAAAVVAEEAEVAAIEDAALAEQVADAAGDAAGDACAAMSESAFEPDSFESLLSKAAAAKHAAELAQQRAHAAEAAAKAAETEAERAAHALAEAQRSPLESANDNVALAKAVEADRDAHLAAVKAKEVAIQASTAAIQAKKAAEGAQQAVDEARSYSDTPLEEECDIILSKTDAPVSDMSLPPSPITTSPPHVKIDWLERAESHPLSIWNATIATFVYLLYLVLFSR